MALQKRSLGLETLTAPFSAGEVQAFYDDLNGRQYVNDVFNFSVDKLYDLLFTDSQFQRDFMEQRRFSGETCSFTARSTIPYAQGLIKAGSSEH